MILNEVMGIKLQIKEDGKIINGITAVDNMATVPGNREKLHQIAILIRN